MRIHRIWPLLAALTLAGMPAAGATLAAALTATAPSDQACNPGPQSSNFSTTTARIWVYTSLLSADLNDLLSFEWVRPDGEIYSITALPGLDQPGGWCFNVDLPIEGTEAVNYPGTWTVRGVYNGADFFTRSFTLTRPGGGTQPTISQGGVVNGASGQPGLSPAQWVTIRGQNLANLVRTLDFVNGSYPTSSDGVSVTFNGQPGFLYYLSPDQINVISPDLAAPGPVQVIVTNNGVASTPVTVDVQPAAPAAFLWPGNYAVATDANYQLKVKQGVFQGLTTTAARADEIVILWVAGLGPTSPSSAAGRAVSANSIHSVTSPIHVRIGGVEAQVIGAALAPGIASLYQIAIKVPNLGNGDHAVTIDVGGITSPAGALLTVQN